MAALLYTLAILGLSAILSVFSYLDRLYRELGRVSGSRFHEHVEFFEAEIEPRIDLDRRRGSLSVAMLTQLLLIAVVVVTAHGVYLLVPESLAALAQLVVYVLAEALLFAQFIPYLLLARSNGRWLGPLVPALRVVLAVGWPFRALIDLAISVSHISDQDVSSGAESTQEGVEALVEVAQEEGILASDDAKLIEQVMEFGDMRVLEVMTPRPDVVGIPADATVAQLRRLMVETGLSRVLVYQSTLDDVLGIAQAQNLLQIPDSEAGTKTVRAITRPVLFVPETKLGSDLLKEMQRLNQHMAVAVDEHGLVAGIITVEDLVEEIVGEMGHDDRQRVPDIVREADGSVLLRGSVSVARVQTLFGVEFAATDSEGVTATTVAGLLNSVAGHVPKSGEHIDYDSLQFEVLEANQRKVLRLRVRPRSTVAPVPGAIPEP